MTPIVLAYAAGRAARAAGWYPTDNPYGDWEMGVAWTAGWYEDVSLPPHSMLAVQCESIKTLIRLEGGYPRGTGYE